VVPAFSADISAPEPVGAGLLVAHSSSMTMVAAARGVP
jgi:hypothetical protein